MYLMCSEKEFLVIDFVFKTVQNYVGYTGLKFFKGIIKIKIINFERQNIVINSISISEIISKNDAFQVIDVELQWNCLFKFTQIYIIKYLI